MCIYSFLTNILASTPVPLESILNIADRVILLKCKLNHVTYFLKPSIHLGWNNFLPWPTEPFMSIPLPTSIGLAHSTQATLALFLSLELAIVLSLWGHWYLLFPLPVVIFSWIFCMIFSLFKEPFPGHPITLATVSCYLVPFLIAIIIIWNNITYLFTFEGSVSFTVI